MRIAALLALVVLAISPSVRADARLPPGPLDRAAILRVIGTHRLEIHDCRAAALPRRPSLKGTLAVEFTIAASGRVTAASVYRDELGDAAVAACVCARVKTWIFPPSDASIALVYPFVFPSDPAP